MGRFQSFLLNTLALVFLLAAGVFVIQNLSVYAPLQIFTTTLEASVGLSMGIVGLLAAGGFALKAWEMMLKARKDRLRTGRQLEKAEVQAESSTERVKALENKIETLEKALNAALKTK